MEADAKLCSYEGKNLEEPSMHRQLVGCLIYLTLTRPDIYLCHQRGELVHAKPEEASLESGTANIEVHKWNT